MLLNPIGRGRSTKRHLYRALQRDGVPIGGQPPRERDAGRRPVLEIVNTLHESLSERRLADERSTLVIANRSGDNLGCFHHCYLVREACCVHYAGSRR